jgi:engulfment/cell motility protein 1
MWNESGASRADFVRVASLVQSQLVRHQIYPLYVFNISFHRIKVALANESSRPWHEVENSFLEMQYREVRDRQLRELELRDELLSKPPVRYAQRKFEQVARTDFHLFEVTCAPNCTKNRTNL